MNAEYGHSLIVIPYTHSYQQTDRWISDRVKHAFRDRQTRGRQTVRQPDKRQTDRWTVKDKKQTATDKIDRYTFRQTDRQIGRQDKTDRDRQTDRQTRQTDRQTRQTQTQIDKTDRLSYYRFYQILQTIIDYDTSLVFSIQQSEL